MRVGEHTEDGFTLIEIMVVVIILGVLLTIAIASYTASTARAASVACENNRRLLERVAASEYRNEHGADPVDIEDLSPYVSNWNSTKGCASDQTQLLYLEDGRAVVCPIHGK